MAPGLLLVFNGRWDRLLTGTLLPAHPRPFADELLSSWLTRLARAHALKLQTFCDLVFGRQRQLWNRDIDRLAPDWLVERLAAITGTPVERVWQTTLAAYQGLLFSKRSPSGIAVWINATGIYHRTRRMHGLQLCAKCLADDETPYYRRAWRLSFVTTCLRHREVLLDACPRCMASVQFHRIELGKPRVVHTDSMALCHHCQFDLRQTSVAERADAVLHDLSRLVPALGDVQSVVDASAALKILRHLCKLLLGRRRHRSFYRFVLAATDQPFVTIPNTGRLFIESMRLTERSHYLRLATTVGRNPALLTDAVAHRALRFNELLRDFVDPPSAYLRVANTATRRRPRS